MQRERTIIKRFLRKHSHLLGYTGALVVFLTFVVKEGLGESWRRLAEAIDSAQYAYSVRREIQARDAQNIESMNFLTNLVIESGKLSSKGRETEEDRELDENAFVLGLAREFEGIDTSLQDLRTILDKLPTNRYSESLAYIKTGERDARLQLDFVESGSPGVYPAKNKSAPVPPKWKYVSKYDQHRSHMRIYDGPPDSPHQRGTDLLDSLEDLQFDVDMFRKDVLEDAETIKKHNESLSKYAWWITAWLFTFGWGIGLLGQIYGVPNTKANSE